MRAEHRRQSTGSGRIGEGERRSDCQVIAIRMSATANGGQENRKQAEEMLSGTSNFLEAHI